MNETDPPYEDTPLRRRAARLAAEAGNFPKGLSEDELSRIIYELEIHQIELEMQNEELRRTQQQLSESHDRYADLYEFAPIGYVTLNQEGTIIAANLAAATMLRMERRRLLGRSLKGFIDARYREVIQEHCGRVFSSQHSQVCEIEMHCGDGRPLEVRLESVATGVGPAAACRTALIDQTEQKEAARKAQGLKESRYQAFTRATSDVIFRMSPDWSELRYLDGRNFIADTHEPLKHWLERYIPVEDQPFLLKTIERAIHDRSVFELEHRVIQVNGAIGWTHSRAIPIIGENSAVIEWFGTASNVTPQKIAALALEDREQRLRAILQTATDGIVSIHSGGSITDVNAATEEMFGYSEPELVGRNISTLLHDPYGDDDSGRQMGFMMEDLGNSVGVGRELLGRRKDGSIFPIELSLSQVDHLQLFTGIIRDVSERKQLQREIITAVEDEQRRIGQDLHDGAQQELVGLQMVAETLKLRLPQLSMHDSDAKSCLRLAEKISDGIRRAAGEIHSIARGLVAVTLDQHGLQNMLQELASRTNAIEGVICAFKCDSEISIDDGWTATHLYRIAQESVTNALKHARPEHILIRLEQCDDKLVLQVADDGEGLDPSKSNEGMGLKTMRYRAELIGARLTIHPVSAGGTLVSCSVY